MINQAIDYNTTGIIALRTLSRRLVFNAEFEIILGDDTLPGKIIVETDGSQSLDQLSLFDQEPFRVILFASNGNSFYQDNSKCIMFLDNKFILSGDTIRSNQDSYLY